MKLFIEFVGLLHFCVANQRGIIADATFLPPLFPFSDYTKPAAYAS